MPSDMDALNYPYIRVRSVDWLKRTLLIFPHVIRMTPHENAPADDPEIRPFCEYQGSRGPLLRSADLGARHVRESQTELIHELDELFRLHGVHLKRRFQERKPVPSDRGQTARSLTVWERRLSDGASFQINRHKMLGELVQYLRRNDLAWAPKQADGPDYLEMNPRLGEAIMATLALACAENEGLQVVTEFPKLHGDLIGVPRRAILQACLEEPRVSGKTSTEQVAEFLVYRRCNVDTLTAEDISALKSEREALADFREKLEDLAATLPPTIHSETRLEERLNDLLNDMFRKWQSDQANLGAYARRLFGAGALDEPFDLAQTLIEAAVSSEGKAGAGAFAIVGGLTLNATAAAAAGFAVAVVYRAVRTWGETRKVAKDSPYRYLSKLQDRGVAFSLTRS